VKRALVVIVVALMLEVGLSFVWPQVVPRFAFLPRPADSEGRSADTEHCAGLPFTRRFQRKGIFWIATHAVPAVCVPLAPTPRVQDLCRRLRLRRPIRFAGHLRWRVCSSEVSVLMSTELGWQGSTGPPELYSRDRGNRPRRTVHDCGDWIEAMETGWFYAGGHYALSMGTRLDVDCGVLFAIGASAEPEQSLLTNIELTDIDEIPATAVRMSFEADGQGELTLGALAERGDWVRDDPEAGVVMYWLEPETGPHDWRSMVQLREVARADFDRDGFEDILVEWYWQSSGTTAYGNLELLTRTVPDGPIQVRIANLPLAAPQSGS
jgi:hypothetical protein